MIVLSDLGTYRDQEIARQLSRPALFIGARDLSNLEVPLQSHRSVIVQPQLQGAQWGIVDLAWKPDARGWYNAAIGHRFSERWDSLKAEHEKIAAWPEQKERNVELERINQAFKEMQAYAPGSLDDKIIYDYRLIDMTEEYAGKNELSETVKRLSGRKKI
jgi:hypothetical protein